MGVLRTLLRSSLSFSRVTSRLLSSKSASEEQYWADRVQLAGAYRVIDNLGLNEGICNHLSLMTRLPGSRPDGTPVMLVIPYGLLWSEVRASDLLAIDANDKVVDGKGDVDITALTLHTEIHKARPDAMALFHTHMPYTTALSLLDDPTVKAYHQNSTRFVKDTAYDYGFGGYADNVEEGRRVAMEMGDKPVMIMQSHGSMISGATVALAFDRLYYLERVCMFQMIAYQSGRPLRELSDEVLERTRKSILAFEDIGSGPHFDAHLRRLRKTAPDFET